MWYQKPPMILVLHHQETLPKSLWSHAIPLTTQLWYHLWYWVFALSVAMPLLKSTSPPPCHPPCGLHIMLTPWYEKLPKFSKILNFSRMPKFENSFCDFHGSYVIHFLLPILALWMSIQPLHPKSNTHVSISQWISVKKLELFPNFTMDAL